ncbi:MAG: hypothetical protein GC193_15340 [Cryomorphaceae bacterium]|nr:hypothetical protein [Cryomorphaceae bacterium]
MKLLFTIVCFTIALIAKGTDVPAGNISGTWTLENSPYIINGHTRVPVGESLTIEAGVEVHFNGPYFMRILGNFLANGAENDSITFTSATGANNWKGIKLDSLNAASDTARFRFCKISRMAGGSIAVINTSKFVLEDSRLFSNTGHFAGFIYTYNSSFKARRNYFHNNATASQSDGGVFYINDGAPVIENNVFRSNTATYSGGAISCWRQNSYTSPIIRNNYFENNSAGSGGAIVVHSNSVPIFSDNIFINNHVSGDGGAIWIGYVQAGTVQFNNNLFTQNNCSQNGGAVRIISSKVDFNNNVFDANFTNNFCGGALQIEEDCIINLTKCRFSNNESGQGGAVHIEDHTNAIFNDCFFNNNSAATAGALLLTYYVEATLTNCIFANNTANIGGAMRLVQFCDPTFLNCTFANNKANDYAGVVSLYWESNPLFANSIFFGNTAPADTTLTVQNYIWNYCDPSFRNCLVQGGQSTVNIGTSTLTEWTDNIDEDPLFLLPSSGAGIEFDGFNANWEFLAEVSPCIDAGTIAGFTIPEFDFAGAPRMLGDNIDLGAFEGGGFVTAPSIATDIANQNLCAADVLTLAMEAEGTTPLFYQWYLDDSALDGETANTLNLTPGNFSSGNYKCRVTNVAGEAFTSEATITVAPEITFDILLPNIPPCPDELTTFEVYVTNGDGPFTYQYFGIASEDPIFPDVYSGDQYIEVFDANGCMSALNFNIPAAPPVFLEIVSALPATCDLCSDGEIQANWSDVNNEIITLNGDLIETPTFTGLAIGTYLITVCNDYGCCQSAEVAIEEDGFPQEIDFNNDGYIGSDDFLIFVGNFGCIGDACAGDLNGDGVVNVADLIAFLGLFS